MIQIGECGFFQDKIENMVLKYKISLINNIIMKTLEDQLGLDL